MSGSLSLRGLRGGSEYNGVVFRAFFAASSPSYGVPTFESDFIGFRVASLVPEPGPGWLGMTAVLGLAVWRKRTAKAL